MFGDRMGGIISCCSYGDIEGERAGGLVGTGVGGGSAPTFGRSFSSRRIYCRWFHDGVHHAFGFPDDRYGLVAREFYSTGSVRW